MNGKHLGYEELLRLYKYISENRSCKEICEILEVNRSTLYRLIMSESTRTSDGGFKATSKFRYCVNMARCKKEGRWSCPASCKEYRMPTCPQIRKFPYICDFCESLRHCRKAKRLFDPINAFAKREERLRKSREGASVSDTELKRIDSVVTPLVKAKVSVEAIKSMMPDTVPVTSRTIRNWIDRFYLTARRADMINAQTRHIRSEYAYPTIGRNPLVKAERTYSDFLGHMEARRGEHHLELDTVHGRQGESACVLTIHCPKAEFQIGLLLPSCTASAVIEALDGLRKSLGDSCFAKLFSTVLADNGPEFDRLHEIEESGKSRVFFTRPYRSGDKGSCEKNHQFMRRFHPKGQPLSGLSQETLNEEFSHINSYPRKSLGMCTPYEKMTALFGTAIIEKLGIRKIEPADLRLKK